MLEQRLTDFVIPIDGDYRVERRLRCRNVQSSHACRQHLAAIETLDRQPS
jgi:hypothetical protein